MNQPAQERTGRATMEAGKRKPWAPPKVLLAQQFSETALKLGGNYGGDYTYYSLSFS